MKKKSNKLKQPDFIIFRLRSLDVPPSASMVGPVWGISFCLANESSFPVYSHYLSSTYKFEKRDSNVCGISCYKGSNACRSELQSQDLTSNLPTTKGSISKCHRLGLKTENHKRSVKNTSQLRRITQPSPSSSCLEHPWSFEGVFVFSHLSFLPSMTDSVEEEP